MAPASRRTIFLLVCLSLATASCSSVEVDAEGSENNVDWGVSIFF